MAKDFRELRAKMSPEQRAKAEVEYKKLLAEMPLDELREARSLTQTAVAQTLGINQAAVSKIEHRTDMYVSTLRSVIQAMGGQLRIEALFPEGNVEINQFRETTHTPAPGKTFESVAAARSNRKPRSIRHSSRRRRQARAETK